MAVAALETREDKLKWLMRPFHWAANACLYMVVVSFGLWYDDASSGKALFPLLGAGFVVILGLLIWGLARMSNAANGRL